jgi:hypothetical protein
MLIGTSPTFTKKMTEDIPLPFDKTRVPLAERCFLELRANGESKNETSADSVYIFCNVLLLICYNFTDTKRKTR